MFKRIEEKQIVIISLGFTAGMLASNMCNTFIFISLLVVIINIIFIQKYWC